MIPVLIIDDEPLARSIICEYISKYPDFEVVGEANDGFEGLKKITELKPKLIFLDIQMPKINGLEMLELIDELPSVIFTTAFDEFAIKAFDNNAIDYLLKPFSEERFAKAISKCDFTQNINSSIKQIIENESITNSQNNRIVVKEKGKIKIIPVGEVHYIEACSDFVKIFTADGVSLKSKTMNYFESSLNPNTFVRIHRSYIINIEQVTKIELYEKDSYLAILKSNEKVPVSKTGYQKLKLIMGL
jgi:two-component system, LytTR family, response regulator